MKVGCVIPVHNRAETIKYPLNSLLNQSFSLSNICLIDDASTDNSRAVADQFIHEKLRPPLSHQLNYENVRVAKQNGVGAVLRIGMRKICHCDLIFSLASDDHISPDYVANAVKIFENSPENLGVVYPGTMVQFQSDAEKNDMPVLRDFTTLIVDEWTNTSAEELKVHNRFINGSSVIKASAYLDVGEFEDFDIYDYHFWLKLCLSGYTAKRMNAIYYYRQHSDQVSKKRSMQKRQIAFQRLWNDIHKKGLA